MSWNHRVIRHEHEGDVFFQVHEVYYDEAGTPTSYTENPVAPGGEALSILGEEIELFRAAISLPVLDASTFSAAPAVMGSWKRVQERNDDVATIRSEPNFLQKLRLCPGIAITIHAGDLPDITAFGESETEIEDPVVITVTKGGEFLTRTVCARSFLEGSEILMQHVIDDACGFKSPEGGETHPPRPKLVP